MDKMVAVLIVGPVIAMTIAGCSDRARFMDQPKTVSIARPAEQIVQHHARPGKQIARHHARPAKQIVSHKPSVRAEAPKSANESEGTLLMKCMSEACRAACSPNVAKESGPKWCAYFTEPI